MARLLLVPHLGTAEDEVLVLEWLVKPDEVYHKGQALLVLETLKASFEVEADEPGMMFERLAGEGERLPIHAPLALIGQVGESPDSSERDALIAEASAAIAQPQRAAELDSKPQVTETTSARGLAPAAPAARRRAAELGVDLDGVQGNGPGGMIRVEDVEQVAAEGARAASGDARGTIEPAFLSQIRDDEASFAAQDSGTKLDLYRRHGANIGEGCRLGLGSVILAERLDLGDLVTIGANCRIEAQEFFAGAGTHFGDRCRVRCRRVHLGENAFFVTDIEIGGGGAMDPEALLEVGSHGFVGEHVHLNACRPLRIGDEVVISRNASLMTHSFGLDVLKGFPNRFAGIHIEDECQVGIGAVLFPGVTMGTGSILLSNSSLVTDLPAGRLFGGIPAKDIKAAARELDAGERLALVESLIREFARQLSLRGLVCQVTQEEGKCGVQVDHEGQIHRLHFADSLPTEDGTLVAEDLRVGMYCDDPVWATLPMEFAAMDLGQKRLRGTPGLLGEAFREYLRKHGIRLSPRNWTYGGGWL